MMAEDVAGSDVNRTEKTDYKETLEFKALMMFAILANNIKEGVEHAVENLIEMSDGRLLTYDEAAEDADRENYHYFPGMGVKWKIEPP